MMTQRVIEGAYFGDKSDVAMSQEKLADPKIGKITAQLHLNYPEQAFPLEICFLQEEMIWAFLFTRIIR